MTRIQCKDHRAAGQLEAHLDAKDHGHGNEQQQTQRTVRLLDLVCGRQSYGSQALPRSMHDIDEHGREQCRFGPASSIGHIVNALGSRCPGYFISNATHSPVPVPIHFASMCLCLALASTLQGTAMKKWGKTFSNKPPTRLALKGNRIACR